MIKMRNLTVTKKTSWLIGLSLAATVFVLVTGSFLWQNIQKQRFRHLPENERMGHMFERMGVMSQQDYVKYDVLSHNASRTGMISDSDLAWMLTLAKSGPTKQRLDNAGVLHSLVFDEFRLIRHLTSPQKEEIMQATVPLTSSTDALDQTEAASVLFALDDSRAVPYLRPMLNSPNPQVKYHAYLALKHLHAL